MTSALDRAANAVVETERLLKGSHGARNIYMRISLEPGPVGKKAVTLFLPYQYSFRKWHPHSNREHRFGIVSLSVKDLWPRRRGIRIVALPVPYKIHLNPTLHGVPYMAHHAVIKLLYQSRYRFEMIFLFLLLSAGTHEVQWLPLHRCTITSWTYIYVIAPKSKK